MRAWFGTASILCTTGTMAIAQPTSRRASITALRHDALSACLAQASPAISDEARAESHHERGRYPAVKARTVPDDPAGSLPSGTMAVEGVTLAAPRRPKGGD